MEMTETIQTAADEVRGIIAAAHSRKFYTLNERQIKDMNSMSSLGYSILNRIGREISWLPSRLTEEENDYLWEHHFWDFLTELF